MKSPTVWDMVRAVTLNPANGLGREDLGRITAGFENHRGLAGQWRSLDQGGRDDNRRGQRPVSCEATDPKSGDKTAAKDGADYAGVGPVHATPTKPGRAAHAMALMTARPGEAEAIAAGIEGPVSSTHPSSVIQLHPRATVVLDEAAASRLQNIDYYRYAWENKPHWQSV